MVDMMRTYRLVVQNVSGDGQSRAGACHVTVDIVVRGQDCLASRHVNDVVHRFLNLDFYGSWVDQGTERDTFTVAARGIDVDKVVPHATQ